MRLPGFLMKKMITVYLHDDLLEFSFNVGTAQRNQTLGAGFEQLILGVDDDPLFDIDLYPHDFSLILNNEFYSNEETYKLFEYMSQVGDKFSIVVPNRTNIGLGKNTFYLGTRGIKMKVRFKIPVLPAPNPLPIKKPELSFSRDETFDFDTQRICPKCGKAILIDHNFCKYCGQDLGDIKPIGKGDAVNKNLALSALTDPSPEVRKEAIDTLGGFKDKSALGVLTYILMNDSDENVRKEAADELGDIHHPLSQDALIQALRDNSPIVRKEALEGLKKIKEKLKPKDSED